MYQYRTPAGREAATRLAGLLAAVRSGRLTGQQSRLIVRALRVLEQESGSKSAPPEQLLAAAVNVKWTA